MVYDNYLILLDIYIKIYFLEENEKNLLTCAGIVYILTTWMQAMGPDQNHRVGNIYDSIDSRKVLWRRNPASLRRNDKRTASACSPTKERAVLRASRSMDCISRHDGTAESVRMTAIG